MPGMSIASEIITGRPQRASWRLWRTILSYDSKRSSNKWTNLQSKP
jgi:hypothetical protein